MKPIKLTKTNWIEKYTEWYFEDLKAQNYIKSFEREPETIQCAPKLKHNYLKLFKKKDPEITEYNLFQDINYTYDYRIIWTDKARYIFYDVIDKDKSNDFFKHGRPPFIANYDYYDDTGNEYHITRLDVKPPSKVAQVGGKVSSLYTFYLKQRMIYELHGIFIEKFVPIPMAGAGEKISRFINTFTPNRYLFTDSGRQTRDIKFGITNLNGFVAERMKQLNL